MTDESANLGEPAAGAASAPGLPAAVDRATFQAELDRLRVREKAHTREGDAIAAARRRLPMVEVDASLTLTGPHGPLTLLDAFDGRRQLIAYYFMWWAGHPAAEQCEGCTWVTTQVSELSYLHSRGITYAVFCQGPCDESARYREFMGWEMPWYSAQDSLDALLAGRRIGRMHLVCYLRDGDRVFETYWTTLRGVEAMDYSYALMDLTVYGRQEPWEHSPPAGRNSAPSRGLTAARRPGRQCRRGRADALSPSGRDWPPGALTTWAPAMTSARTTAAAALAAAVGDAGSAGRDKRRLDGRDRRPCHRPEAPAPSAAPSRTTREIGDSTMTSRRIGTRQEWLAASAELLEREKQLTRMGDELARQRRELPWVPIGKKYRFQTEGGTRTLAELFDGRSQLVVYHFMFGPGYQAGCPAWSSTADSFNGVLAHLQARDVTMICVSRAPLGQLLAYRERMGWSFTWASSHDSDFNADFGVSAGESATHAPAAPRPQANELALLKLLTEQPTASENLPLITTLNAASTGTDLEGYFSEGHGVSTFAREGGTVYHCYSSYARGTEFLMGYYAILDRAPKGRDEYDNR